MRKLIVTLLALAAFPAMAADYPQNKPYSVPVSQLWSGNWIGIQGSYAFQGDLTNPLIGGFGVDGWAGGLSIGAQTQTGNWVWGLELEGSYGKINGSTGIGPVGIQHETEALGSLRARLGYAVGPVHVYGLGGFALASTRASIAAGPFSATDTKTHYGYVLGAGAEYMIDRNWLVGVEYAYYNFGSETYGFPIVGPIGLATPADFDIHTMKAKVAYKF